MGRFWLKSESLFGEFCYPRTFYIPKGDNANIPVSLEPICGIDNAASFRSEIGCVYLNWISGTSNLGSMASAREKCFHLNWRVVLCFIDEKECILEASPAHEHGGSDINSFQQSVFVGTSAIP